MTGALPALRGRVEPHAEKCQTVADARPDGRRVLADAAGEHERVESAERGGEGADPLA